MNGPEHDVRLDYAGPEREYERLTCKGCPSHGGAEVTAVCQEWQKGGQWQGRKRQFLAEHPCQSIKIVSHDNHPDGEIETGTYLRVTA